MRYGAMFVWCVLARLLPVEFIAGAPKTDGEVPSMEMTERRHCFLIGKQETSRIGMCAFVHAYVRARMCM